MPIRASVLRRPASKAARRLATAASGGQRPRRRALPASSAASSTASHGTTAVAPAATAIASGVDVEDVGRVDDDVGPAAETGRPSAPCGPRRRRGRDGIGRRSTRHRPVGDDEELDRPVATASTRVGREARRARRRARRAVGRRARSRRAGARGVARTAATSPSRSATTGDGRAGSVRGAAGMAAEQRRSPAELDPEVHHRPLALRVDRRVRDLGERLAEVVRDRPVDPRPGRASACRRPCSRAARCASRAIVLMSSRARSASSPASWRSAGAVARRRSAGLGGGAGHGPVAATGRSTKRRSRGIRAPRSTEDLGLRLDVLEDRPAPRVDEQHLARSRAARAGRSRRRRSGWRPASDAAATSRIAGHGERERTEAVPIDHRADPPPVAEARARRGRPTARGARPSAGRTHGQRVAGRCAAPAHRG